MKIEVFVKNKYQDEKPRVVVHTGLYSKEAYQLFDELLEAEHQVCPHSSHNFEYTKLGLMPQNISIGNWMDTYQKQGDSKVRYKYVGIAEDGEVVFWIPEFADVYQEACFVDFNEPMFISSFCCIIEAYIYRYTRADEPKRSKLTQLFYQLKYEPTDEKLIGVPFNPIQETLYKAIREEIKEIDDKAYETFSSKSIANAAWENVVKWVGLRLDAYDRIEQLYDC